MSSAGNNNFSSKEDWLTSLIVKYAGEGTEIACGGNSYAATEISKSIREIVSGRSDKPTQIHISKATFDGDFDLERISGPLSIRFVDCRFQSNGEECLTLRLAKIDSFQATGCNFSSNVTFDYAEFSRHLIIHGHNQANPSRLSGTLRIHWAQARGNVDFMHLRIERSLSMLGTHAEVFGQLNIYHVNCDGRIDFTHFEVHGRLNIEFSAFEGKMDFNKSIFRDVAFIKDCRANALIIEGPDYAP